MSDSTYQPPAIDFAPIVREVVRSYPESSFCLRCIGWQYEEMIFTFLDEEVTTDPVNVERETVRVPTFTGEDMTSQYTVREADFIRGAKLLAAEVDKRVAEKSGSQPYGFAGSAAMVDPCNWDAISLDAMTQMAVFGEVIYG